jgi:hypothetical protein
MKKRKVFKTIATHMLTQNEVSEDDYNCLYRTSAGLLCAIGILIDNDNYSEELESHDVHNSAVSTAVSRSLGSPPLSSGDRVFLGALQDIHDYSVPPEWRKKLNDFSVSYFGKDLEDVGVEA